MTGGAFWRIQLSRALDLTAWPEEASKNPLRGGGQTLSRGRGEVVNRARLSRMRVSGKSDAKRGDGYAKWRRKKDGFN